MRKFVCAVAVALVAISISLAADYNGRVVEIKDGKITILSKKGKKDTEGKKTHLPGGQ